MAFSARYPGKCAACGQPYDAGALLRTIEPKRYAHSPACPTTTQRPDVTAPASGDVTETFTFEEFIDWSRTSECSAAWAAHDTTQLQGSIGADDESWNGGISHAEAIRYAEQGWPEGLERLVTLETVEAPRSDLKHPRCEYAPAGVRPSVPHFLAGEPGHMMNFVPRPSARRPVFNLVVMSTASASVNADSILRRGAAVMSLVDTLEDQGISVSLTLSYGAEQNGRTIRLDIIAKEAGQPLDRDRIVFATTHPSMFRRLAFRWMEQDRFYHSHAPTYGRPASPPKITDPDTMLVTTNAGDLRPVSEIAADFLKLYEAHINQE